MNGGCEMLLPSDPSASRRFLFMSDYDGRAVINLNVHDIRFQLVRPTEPSGTCGKGDRFRAGYSSGSTVVRMKYTVTGPMPAR
jgi:hypothetical protein